MAERRGHLGFTGELLQELGVDPHLGSQHLDGVAATQTRMSRLEHLTRAAPSDRPNDPIRTAEHAARLDRPTHGGPDISVERAGKAIGPWRDAALSFPSCCRASG